MLKAQKEIQYIESLRLDKIMSLGYVEVKYGVAIDGGAHIGSWTHRMLQFFDKVHAFEPCDKSFEILTENCPNARLYRQALMDKCCRVSVNRPRPKRSALTARRVDYGGDTEAVTIDSLELSGVDLIKLDLEGAEYPALLGARKTIKRYHPFLVVEFDGQGERFGVTNQDLERLIAKLGYKQVWSEGVDRGFTWNNI